MPLLRPRRREEEVEYVVVERTEENKAQEMERWGETATATPTTFVSPPQDYAPVQPTVLQIRDDDSDSDSDDEDDGPPEVWTLTVIGAQSTGGALAANHPAATAVVAAPPPRDGGMDGNPDGGPHKGGISQTTEHLLIAAGSIGATIVLVMIVLAIYTMRKRGLTLAQAIKQGKHQVTRRGPPPPPKSQPSWDAKQSFSNDYGALRKNTVTPPQAALSRSGSPSSQTGPIALGRSDSFNLQNTKSADGRGSTFLLESPPPPRRDNSNRSGPTSITPSYAVLGQDSRRSVSTHNTRSVDENASELMYKDVSQERTTSPLPPPPTFKQFLNNRPSISGKAGFGGMMSRFSWTNSNAPQTPKVTTSQDPYQGGRESYMTSRSSVPRFRTVDSWVNQQTNRIEAQKLKEQFRLTSTSTVYTQDEEADHIPEVPAMPKNVERLRESSAPMSASLPLRAPATPPLPPSMGLPGKNIKHERHDTRTTVDTAPVFKQHPGNEVRFSTRSTVPSEILDRGRPDNVLS
ncbi:hypothetical protein PMIN02_009677 [Paraphaeosphaeria minitans]|uniref:Uncharacterized protein n=1 Tax=Paraphaeosphaeria minitans TaxID=565426 RepID=A0A9P6KMC9_9PLEO|nr:hypothetical protein PMIN01_09301 [Paraphaeosphaeria minitans]